MLAQLTEFNSYNLIYPVFESPPLYIYIYWQSLALITSYTPCSNSFHYIYIYIYCNYSDVYFNRKKDQDWGWPGLNEPVGEYPEAWGVVVLIAIPRAFPTFGSHEYTASWSQPINIYSIHFSVCTRESSKDPTPPGNKQHLGNGYLIPCC